MKKLFVLLTLVLVGCGGAAEGEHDGDTFGQCEMHVKQLRNNVNGCWRITSRQGFMQNESTYMCSAEPTCEVIPGDDQDYVSGDVAWVGDVECSNTCKP